MCYTKVLNYLVKVQLPNFFSMMFLKPIRVVTDYFTETYFFEAKLFLKIGLIHEILKPSLKISKILPTVWWKILKIQ